MLALAGIVVVFFAVLGGFLLERGNPYLLLQPAELLIIVGASAGILIIANPPRVLSKIAHGASELIRSRSVTRAQLLRYLLMLYEVFGYAQRAGAMGLEDDVEHPGSSRIFSRYPEFLADLRAREFLCDSLRILVIGVSNAAELDHLMDLDIDVQRRGAHEPASALSSIADSLPGLGIVAAVLGVVITMSSIGGAPETIGQKVAAALVGTFIGILLCYGVVGPLAARLEAHIEERSQLFEVIRMSVGAFARGAAPILAVEYARRSIPVEMRPSFIELEAVIRKHAQVPQVTGPAAAAVAAGGAKPKVASIAVSKP